MSSAVKQGKKTSNNQGSNVKEEKVSINYKIQTRLSSLKEKIKELIDKYKNTKQSDSEKLKQKIKEYNDLNNNYQILLKEENTIKEQLEKLNILTNDKINDPNSNIGSKVTELAILYNELKEKEGNLNEKIKELDNKVKNLENQINEINNYVDNFVKEEEEEINNVLNTN